MPQPVQASTYTFRHLIDGGFLYVDKTRYLYDLVRPGTGLYFLARPRRFGKSLMLSTLEEIFLGNRALFEGLWIDSSDYDWQTYPVMRIDFSWSTIHNAAALQQAIDSYIEEIAESHEIIVRGYDCQSRFRNLLLQLSKEGRLVVLIDEYDKPLIDNLENLPVAIEIRDTLRSFYGIIKSMDRYLRFVFITGISKFSKVGVFSVLNNLTDITMSPHFATALGITEAELTSCFADHIDAFAQQESFTPTAFVAKIRQWYDGFCFVEESPSVYNPFSTLQLFYNHRFSNYWFETGTPTFLIKLLKTQKYDITLLNDLRLRELGFSTYELESLSVVPLLFQTGYLTIKAYEPTRRVYTLGYPNSEVEDAFLTYLLSEFSERDRGTHEYAAKYQLQHKPVTLVGANFNSSQRQVSEWDSSCSSP